MEIRNLMEEKVLSLINELCDEDEASRDRNYCTSPECRLDAACYVLNRIPQRYVTSGRGFAHWQNDLQDNLQLHIDMVTLAHEGLRRVSTVQRNYYGQEEELPSWNKDEGYWFFFPTIQGRLFNGVNFEPILSGTVTLKLQGKPVEMIDHRWTNPFELVGNTPGTYLFWPCPLAAAVEGQEETFEFSIEVLSDDCETLIHYLSVPTRSEAARSPRQSIRDLNLGDLFLIPKTSVSTMEWSVIDDDLPMQ